MQVNNTPWKEVLKDVLHQSKPMKARIVIKKKLSNNRLASFSLPSERKSAFYKTVIVKKTLSPGVLSELQTFINAKTE